MLRAGFSVTRGTNRSLLGAKVLTSIQGLKDIEVAGQTSFRCTSSVVRTPGLSYKSRSKKRRGAFVRQSDSERNTKSERDSNFGRISNFDRVTGTNSVCGAMPAVEEQSAVEEQQDEYKVPHAKAAWEFFRSIGSPKYHVAPMVDQV